MTIEAMKQAVRVMGLIGADLICGVAHHGKKDQHELGEPCPVQQRFHEAFETLRTAIEQAEKQEPVEFVTGYYGGRCVIEPLNPATNADNPRGCFYAAPVSVKEES